MRHRDDPERFWLRCQLDRFALIALLALFAFA